MSEMRNKPIPELELRNESQMPYLRNGVEIMTEKTEMLPCPFCGSTELKTVVDDGIPRDEDCRACAPAAKGGE